MRYFPNVGFSVLALPKIPILSRKPYMESTRIVVTQQWVLLRGGAGLF